MKSILICLVFAGIAIACCSAADAQSSVPQWDARGVELLPRQGVACFAVADDASQIVVGTFASPGDPNVFVLDAEGRLLRSQVIGQRAIGQVSLSGRGHLHALCTMPDGRAGDGPTVFACQEPAVPIPSGLGEAGYPRTIFHYGDHSNHTSVQLGATRAGNVVLYGNHVLWLDQFGKQATATAQVPWSGEAVATVLATHSSGAAVAGFSVLKSTADPPEANLFLVYPGEKQPRWKRQAVKDLGESRRPEKGLYGTPTLRDGTREELPQHDLPVVAPLSLAVNRGQTLTRIATADYPGWQRWIRSSATGREQNYGTRFMPAPATVSVYDQEGTLIRRFGPERFGKPGWLDLAFLPGDRLLLAYPHHWTCRGLAGQPHLPVDDEARTAWLLDVENGDVRPLEFPDAVADAAVNDEGRLAITCWAGRLYLLAAEDFGGSKPPPGVDIRGPALVRSRQREGGWVVAGASGLIQLLDAAGKLVREFNLSDGRHTLVDTQPWVINAKAEKINDGLWQLPGGRVESDLGGQRVIEGPDGVILIEGHAGLSFERERKAMRSAGLDPGRVKYVLTTHEHGDHSPGAYLWRVTTGAKFVCSEEMAYMLQHHIPQSTGYGLHPPVAADVRVKTDQDLDLCGVKVRAIRLPGHSFGSMGWMFERGGKKYVAIGDLIMPDGVLGYSGSVNFSGTDVLTSLRKLESLGVDYILPGHGPITSPERYVAAGIGVGRHVGWGKLRPEAPDPRYRMEQENVIVAAWNLDQTSADFGDLNGDGLADVAIVVPEGHGAVVKAFLNQGGKFAEKPDVEFSLPGVAEPNKLRLRELNGDARIDIFIGGRSSALLLSQGKPLNFDTTLLSLGDGNQARRIELDGAQADIIVNARFGTCPRRQAAGRTDSQVACRQGSGLELFRRGRFQRRQPARPGVLYHAPGSARSQDFLQHRQSRCAVLTRTQRHSRPCGPARRKEESTSVPARFSGRRGLEWRRRARPGRRQRARQFRAHRARREARARLGPPDTDCPRLPHSLRDWPLRRRLQRRSQARSRLPWLHQHRRRRRRPLGSVHLLATAVAMTERLAPAWNPNSCSASISMPGTVVCQEAREITHAHHRRP